MTEGVWDHLKADNLAILQYEWYSILCFLSFTGPPRIIIPHLSHFTCFKDVLLVVRDHIYGIRYLFLLRVFYPSNNLRNLFGIDTIIFSIIKFIFDFLHDYIFIVFYTSGDKNVYLFNFRIRL